MIVYCAHPMTSYGTPHEAACLGRLAELLPGVRLYNPEGRYATDAAWRRAWPRVLDRLSGLVVFEGDDGTVGTGCWREIGDALAYCLPTAVLSGSTLYDIAGVTLLDPECRSPRSVGHVVRGRRYVEGEYLAEVAALAHQLAALWDGARP